MGCGCTDPLSLTSALAGGEWSASRPSPFTTKKELARRLGGPQSRSGRRGEEEVIDPTEIRTRPARSQSYFVKHMEFRICGVFTIKVTRQLNLYMHW
jgi:hypothetical protein